MQSSTRLSIKRNESKLFAAHFTFTLVFILSVFINFNSKSQTSLKPEYSSNRELSKLLANAERCIYVSPDSAEQFAKQLLVLSNRDNNFEYVVRSQIVLGNIKKLKGEQSLAYHFYNTAASLAHAKKMVAEECEAVLAIGEIIYKKGEYDLALIEFKKADSLASVNNLDTLQSRTLFYLGKYNHTKGNMHRAQFYYHKSLEKARKNKDEKQLAILLPSLGKHYISEGKLNAALSCYQEAYNLSMKLKDQFLSADICNHLGGFYLDLKESKKAMEYHKEALLYRLAMNYPGELAKSYNNIGKIHLSLNELDSAEYYFDKSLDLCKETNYKKGLVKALTNLGEVQRLKGHFSKAAPYLYEALKISQSIGYDNGIAEASLDIGELFSNKKSIDSAITYYNIALEKFGKTNYNDDLLRVYSGLYNSYLTKLDYKTALNYHKSVLETEKKLLDVENKRQLAIVNISFDTERKEQDYRVLLKDNELKASLIKSKNTFIWLIVASLGFMILLFAYVYNRFYIKKEANKKLHELNQTITNQNIQLKKLNKEIESVSKDKDKLFTIISHELRNPLYWLQNLAEVLSRKHNSMPADKISKTLNSMDESAKNVYHLMDNLLHWSRSKLNRVHPKKSAHNLYTLISETSRMYDSFMLQKEISFTIDIPNDVYIYADGDLFACVIRNLISNAIKYTPNGGNIDIKNELSSTCATLIISDSGRGMSPDEVRDLFTFDDKISMPGLMQEKGSGIGLKLCKDFVELNDGKIWADSISGSGTVFFFTIPLIDSIYNKQEELGLAVNVC